MLNTLQSSLRKKKSDKGFTLIELLVVILIIGILSAIVVVAVRGSTGDAKTKACAQNAQNLMAAIDTYATANADAFPAGATDPAPAAINATQTGVTINNAYPIASLQTALVPTFIKSVPDPTADNVVAVTYTLNGKTQVGVLCQLSGAKNAGI